MVILGNEVATMSTYNDYDSCIDSNYIGYDNDIYNHKTNNNKNDNKEDYRVNDNNKMIMILIIMMILIVILLPLKEQQLQLPIHVLHTIMIKT